MKKGPIQDSICFKLVPRLLVLRPLFKVAFKTPNKSNLHSRTSQSQNKDAKGIKINALASPKLGPRWALVSKTAKLWGLEGMLPALNIKRG